MAIAIPVITTALDVPVGDTVHNYGVIAGGGTPPLVTYRIHNNFGGGGPVDDSRNWQWIIEARISGATEWEVRGIAALTNGTFKVRQTAENSLPVSRGWVTLGTGIALPLADLVDGEYHEFEIQPQPPATGPELVIEWRLSLALATAITVGDSAIVPQGIRRGVGRGEVTGVVDRSGSIGATGLDQLDVPDYNFVHLGAPHSELVQAITLDANDSAPAALGAGEEYPFYLATSTAGLAIVKGLLKTAPLVYPDDWPALTGDDTAIAYGQRHFSNNLIVVELPAAEPDFYHANVVGTDAIIGNTGGPVLVGTERQDTTTPNTVPLGSDGTYSIWVLPDQTFAVTTDGSRPLPTALLLWEITMVAGVETARVDRRRWVGASHMIQLRFEAPQDLEEVAWCNGTNRGLWVRPESVRAFLEQAPPNMTLPPGSGELAFDLLVVEDGVAEVSLFTSSPSPDRRPKFAFGDSNQSAWGLPEVLYIPPGAMLVSRAHRTFDQGDPRWANVCLIADED